MTEIQENKNCYINSLEACDIYDHMHKGKYINMNNYIGMIPYSIELIKLEEEGFKIRKDKNGKNVSNDMINVKFTTNVKSARKQIPKLEKSLEYHKTNLQKNNDLLLETSKRKRNKIKKRIDKILKNIDLINHQLKIMKHKIDDESMKEIKRDELRTYLYKKGFIINGVTYKPYKRSSAKSRKGEMTFIKKSLHKRMIDWSRMGLDFKKSKQIDYPSLLAYESLVMSSILQDDNGLLHIPIDKMLLVSDVESVFTQNVNVVQKNNNTGYLDSITKETDVSSDLFDGESLLDSKFFSNDSNKGMKLLRSHFFKSCAFNTNIQTFMKDNYNGENYNEWVIFDMFNNPIKAKDVEFIFTPSSLKALKFSELVGSKNDMYQYWKSKIDKEGYNFGVCKQEKPSQRGFDNEGHILQQTSYQFINSLPLESKDIDVLMKYEKDHIDKLKNDRDYFMEYIKENANLMNANNMFYDLYKHNPNIANTNLFKTFKRKNIHSYVEHIKSGKVRIRGDYAVLGGNLYEYLLHSIGELPTKNGVIDNNYKPLLQNNEIHTKLFNDKDELVAWRNPHTSQSNVLVCKNKIDNHIEKYFNLSENIVVVNAIKFPIQSILSGADYDSDTMAIVKDNVILDAAKKCYGKYNVSINNIESDKKKFKVNYNNMAKIDNDLSKSTLWIGRVVNENQHALSIYWDKLKKGYPKEELELLVKQIDKFTILSEVAIDLAKKKVDVNVDNEINRIKSLVDYMRDDNGDKLYPLFFKKVKKTKRLKTAYHDTSMDKLINYLSNIDYADRYETISFSDLLIDKDFHSNNVNRNQRQVILDITDEMINKIKKINHLNYNKEEKFRALDDVYKFYTIQISKMKVTEETMHSIIVRLSSDNENSDLRLLKILYDYDNEMFKKSFISQ